MNIKAKPSVDENVSVIERFLEDRWRRFFSYIAIGSFVFILHWYIITRYYHLVPSLLYFAVPAFLAFIYVIILTPLMIFLAKKFDITDKPIFKRRHKKSIPLLGGLIIYIAFVCVFDV